MISRNYLLSIFMACLAAASSTNVLGATIHVNINNGDDTRDGAAAGSAFKTIQKACDTANPGDTVIVYPGVYFENIRLKRVGTAERPIIFRADAVARNRVVVTGALPDVREGKVKWSLEDDQLQLYSIPLAQDVPPARVTYSGVDLQPYKSVEELKKFVISVAPSGKPMDYPGPRHGFALDAAGKKLYVRLHAGENTREFLPAGAYGKPRHSAAKNQGRYGPTDPNLHTMAVSQPMEAGVKGDYVSTDRSFNWGVVTEAPAHVVLDGFTFEAAAAAGVYVRGSHVTVRNCWFIGCKAGVRGGTKTDNDAWTNSDNVTVEYCDYTEFPAYSDAEELINRFADDPAYKSNRFFWWSRKGMSDTASSPLIARQDYESGGPITEIGKDWIFRHNRVHETFDGPSADRNGGDRLDISHNRFERIVDNAVETEDHAVGWRIHHNEIIDVYMPISWQPLAGMPWPGPIYVYRNLIYNTPEGGAMWRRAGYPASWFKAGARESNWKWPKHMVNVPKDKIEVPGDGFLVYNNTVVLQDGYFLERTSGFPVQMKKFRFASNIFVTVPIHAEEAIHSDTAEWFDFDHNIYAPPSRTEGATPGQVVAGKDGKVLSDLSAIGFFDSRQYRFDLQPGSPAIGAGVVIEGQPDSSKDAGAVPAGQRWEPLTVGPQSLPTDPRKTPIAVQQ